MLHWLRTLANRDEEEGALGRHSFLLASLLFLLFALPLAHRLSGAELAFPLLLALVLVAAILVNLRQRGIFVVAVLFGLVAITGIIGTEYLDAGSVRIASLLMSLGLLGFTTLVLLNSLIHADEVSGDTIVGGMCVYLLIGLCYAVCFILMTELEPGVFVSGDTPIARSDADTSFHATQLLYYSFVTLTTLGYGDIVPVGEIAQMFSVAEALIGQLYLTIFVARLVALYVAPARRAPPSV